MKLLSILIATHRIYATVFGTFSLIGADMAANVERFEMLYSKRKELRYIKVTVNEGLKATARARTRESRKMRCASWCAI